MPRGPMSDELINPNDSLLRQNEKLKTITAALMRRAEQDNDQSGAAYAQFERAALLEDQVRDRTRDLEHALELLNFSNAALTEARRAAERAHGNMANAIEAVQEGFALFDAGDRLVMCNQRFGMHMPDVQPHLVSNIHFTVYVARVSQSRFLDLEGGTSRRDWARKRLRMHREPHVMFNVRLAQDKWLQVSEHRTTDGGTVVLQTDVTDIIRLERFKRSKMLDNQARMLRATLEHLNQGVCIFDKDTALLDWNARLGTLLALPASLLRVGMGFDRLLDHLQMELAHSTEQHGAFRAWAHQDTPRRALRFEVMRRPNLTLDIFAQEMPNRGFVVSVTDVSAERNAARSLAEANELLERRVQDRTLELEDALAAAERANASKSRFVAAASHDLLQPLSAAKLYVSDLSNRSDAGAPTAKKALNALGSVEAIIDALLNISKLDAGALSLDVTTVSLGSILTALRDEFEPAARLKGLDLRIQHTDAQVTSDPSFLRRILQNLIGNAVRYTETGRILVGTRRHGAALRVEVWDTGPGIAEQDQDRIFREFEQLNPGDGTGEGGGLGLGLAIVERACARLGHPLGLHSVVGQGTRFFVTLERAEPQRSPQGALNARPDPTPGSAVGLVVLLVENDDALRPALARLIENWGADVLEARDAAEAVQLLTEIQLLPDAAVIDYQLGDGPNGLALARQLSNLSPALEACILSADRSEALADTCRAQDLPRFGKPVEQSELRSFLVGVAQRKGPDMAWGDPTL